MSFRRMTKQGGGIKKKRRFIGPRQFIGPRGPPPGFSQRRLLNQRTGGFLGKELKFFDVDENAGVFTTTWAVQEPDTTNLTAVAQGDGESNRDGRKYAMHSIHLKGMVSFPTTESATAPVADSSVRLVLVLDTQTNGAQLTATDVMDGGGSVDLLSFRNLQFTKRFKVLWDKLITVKPQGTNEGAINLFANSNTQRLFSFNKKFAKPIPVTMKGTTADIANVTDNSIHLIVVGTDASLNLQYQSRLRFTG